MENVPSPSTEWTRSSFDELQSVRAFDFVSQDALDTLMPSTADSKMTVWVTACLGAQLFCKQKGFIVTTKQNETIDTSAGTTPTITQGETLGLKQTKFVCSLCSVFKTHEQ